MEYNILIGGKAGQGVETGAQIITEIIHSNGFYIFSSKDYMSRVRGGHNFVTIRFSDKNVNAAAFRYNVIMSLDENTSDLHHKNLIEGGAVLSAMELEHKTEDVIKVDAAAIAKQIGNSKVLNTVLIGALCRYFGLDISNAEHILSGHFTGTVLEKNIEALKAGFDSIEGVFHCAKAASEPKGILVNGNEAFASGCIAGGVSFYSAYPMTPATSIMKFFSSVSEDLNILVEQAEDEIAAINMAIGASYSGARAMTGSSGGGFALMTEGVGLSGVTETPLVIAEVQRPGPATGFSTRTEQGDLLFTLFCSQGEFPRMITSVTDHENAFETGVRVQNLAQKYQIPVIVLSDQYMADAIKTTEEFDFDSVEITDSILKEYKEDYKRYEYTQSGVSPRLLPGSIKGMTVMYDSHEHNEASEIVEDCETRINMMKKRMKKEDMLLQDDINEPEYFGADDPKTLFVGFGSAKGAIEEAVRMLNDEAGSVGALIFSDIWPFPSKKLQEYKAKTDNIINVEQNFTGQLAKVISMQTGIRCSGSILKYDGRPFSPYQIYKQAKELI